MDKFFRELRSRNIAKAHKVGVPVGDTAASRIPNGAKPRSRRLVRMMTNSRWIYFAPETPPKDVNKRERRTAQKQRREGSRKAFRAERKADIMSHGRRLPGSFETGKRR